jgi:uncharacterized protein YecE (DUF72 family)
LRVLVGAGGWQYYAAEGDKLSSYSERFDFVEVNSTFYSNPSLKSVSSWRSRVPESFEFTVKCSRVITHEHEMRPEPEALAELDYMVRVCQLLGAKLIVLQTPSSLHFGEEEVRRSLPLFKGFSDQGIMPAFEPRGGVSESGFGILKDAGVVHAVDLTRSEPRYRSEILYARLFGAQRYSKKGFGEPEYSSIEARVSTERPKVAYLAFHGIQMYSDAAGFRKRVVESMKGL